MTREPSPEEIRPDLTPTLIASLREGDEEAGTLLNDLYRGCLVRFCIGYLGNQAEAEDAVQDVFCRVLKSDRVPDNIRPWIYAVARNRCLDILRSRRRRSEDNSLPGDSQLIADLTGRLTRLVREEQRARLYHLLEALPVSQREILRLRYIEKLGRAEIGQILGIPEKLVKSRLFEGMEKLRKHTSLVDDR